MYYVVFQPGTRETESYKWGEEERYTPGHRDIIFKWVFRCGRGSEENEFL